jgi:hypothetical protein
MKKTVQIVTIPLDKKGWNKDELLKHILKDNTQYSQVGDYKLINGGNSLNAKCWQPQQLLILSDDGIFPKDNLYGDGKLVVANNEWSGETNIEWKKVIASYPHIEGTLPISKETVQAWIDSGTPGECSVEMVGRCPLQTCDNPTCRKECQEVEMVCKLWKGNLLLEFQFSRKQLLNKQEEAQSKMWDETNFSHKPSIPTDEEIKQKASDVTATKWEVNAYIKGYKQALKDLGHE